MKDRSGQSRSFRAEDADDTPPTGNDRMAEPRTSSSAVIAAPEARDARFGVAEHNEHFALATHRFVDKIKDV